MVASQEALIEPQRLDAFFIESGRYAGLQATHKGKVEIAPGVVLDPVLYVPDLDQNIFSVSQDGDKYKTGFGGGRCLVESYEGGVVLQGVLGDDQCYWLEIPAANHS